MQDFEERILFYKKAGLLDKVIIEKIRSEFGDDAAAKASKILIEKKLQKNKKQKSFLIKLGAFVCIGLVVIFIVYFFLFLHFSEFSSAKCNSDKKITITGDLFYREKVFNILKLIEEKDCGYTNFVLDNINAINSGGVGFIYSGVYYTNKPTEIASLTGSRHYVASIIVHEACHGYQHKNNLGYSEPDCALTQYHFLINTNAPSEEAQKVVNAGKVYLNYAFTENNTDVFLAWKNNKK